nr:speckle-type POZ protein B-like [Parasteatoda tepidariorum]
MRRVIVLGDVLNNTWELRIVRNCKYNCTAWNFYLRRYSENKEVEDEVKLLVKVVSYGLVLQTKNVIFLPGMRKRKVATMEDYKLDFFFIFESKAAKNKDVAEEFQIVKLNNLSASFQEMFEKEYMTDTILVCDSITLKAHKCVLSSQSPVFEAIYANNNLTSKLDRVVIEDINPSIFRAMVSFMYSGRLKMESEAMAYDLLHAAAKYQIEGLKEGCIEYLKSILSCANAIKILEIAHVSDKQMKLHCLSYIKEQYEQIKLTENWRDLKLKNPTLALEVYSYNESSNVN